MMVGTALPDLAVRRLERSEDSLTYDIDICGSLKFCPAGQGGEDSHGVAQDPSAQLYFYLKEGDLRWGDVSFFAGAPLSPRESPAACALLSVCCSTRRRTVLAMSFESAHDLGRSRYLELTIVTGM